MIYCFLIHLLFEAVQKRGPRPTKDPRVAKKLNRISGIEQLDKNNHDLFKLFGSILFKI